MKRKIITYLLLFSFLNYIGCSSTVLVTVDEFNMEKLAEDPPIELFITTNDSKKYHFSNREYYYFSNDTLYARGTVVEYYIKDGEKIDTKRMIKIDGIILPEEIKSIEDSGMDEIKVITNSAKEYNFVNKGYYYIENDTLYGQGEIQRLDEYEYFEGQIAVSDIKTIHSGLRFNGQNAEYKFNHIKAENNGGVVLTVLMKNGDAINGELLSLRDRSIIICTGYSATEKELAGGIYPIIEIEGREIRKITVEGESDIGIGAGYAALIGAAIGISVGLASEDDKPGMFSMSAGDKAVCLGIVFSLLGAIIVGFGSSGTTEVIIQLPPDYDFSILKHLSRYPDEEPEYLKKIM